MACINKARWVEKMWNRRRERERWVTGKRGKQLKNVETFVVAHICKGIGRNNEHGVCECVGGGR